MVLCNYCQLLTSTKLNDCVSCGLSKPTGAMIQAEIDQLKSELAEHKAERERFSHYAKNWPMLDSLIAENSALKSVLKEGYDLAIGPDTEEHTTKTFTWITKAKALIGGDDETKP